MNATDQKDQPMNSTFDAKEVAVMLLHEDLARARMRESQRVAAQGRLVRRLSKARRWQRIAEWARRHEAKASAEV